VTAPAWRGRVTARRWPHRCTLDATNRLLALKKLPGWEDALAQWGLEGRTSGELSQLLDSRATYSADGLDVLTQTGPIQQLVVGDDPSDVRTLRPFTTYAYDEGKPDGVAYHLVTTTTSMAIDPATGDTFAAVATVNGYNPVDRAPALGATSGWVHKQPTTITIDAGQLTALTATMLYDARGRVIQSSKPGSFGSDAATTRALFYTAGANHRCCCAAGGGDEPGGAGGGGPGDHVAGTVLLGGQGSGCRARSVGGRTPTARHEPGWAARSQTGSARRCGSLSGSCSRPRRPRALFPGIPAIREDQQPGHRGHAQQRNRERPKERRPEGLRGHSCHQRQEESEDDARRRALPQVHLLTHFIMVSVPISRISNRLGQMPPRSLT
jgi:hypothetical protein